VPITHRKFDIYPLKNLLGKDALNPPIMTLATGLSITSPAVKVCVAEETPLIYKVNVTPFLTTAMCAHWFDGTVEVVVKLAINVPPFLVNTKSNLFPVSNLNCIALSGLGFCLLKIGTSFTGFKLM
jgi:hypothetical protein